MFAITTRKSLILATLTFAAMSSVAAFADPVVDFIPQSLSWKVQLDDDVSNTYSQHVSLKIKNIGTTAWHNSALDMGIQIAGRQVTGSIYGWESNGNYWHLGAKIAAGAEGLVMLRLPLRTLRHCQNLNVTIDTGHQQQVGAVNIFQNDRTNLLAIEQGSMRACAFPPRP